MVAPAGVEHGHGDAGAGVARAVQRVGSGHPCRVGRRGDEEVLYFQIRPLRGNLPLPAAKPCFLIGSGGNQHQPVVGIGAVNPLLHQRLHADAHKLFRICGV